MSATYLRMLPPRSVRERRMEVRRDEGEGGVDVDENRNRDRDRDADGEESTLGYLL